MTKTADFIRNMSEEDKVTTLVDLTEIAFNLAATLRTLEVFAQSSVELANMTKTPVNFTSVGVMLLTMRGDEDGDAALSEKAQQALDHPKVAKFISDQLESYGEKEYGIALHDLDEDGLQEIIDAIEQALANGDTTLDALSQYL